VLAPTFAALSPGGQPSQTAGPVAAWLRTRKGVGGCSSEPKGASNSPGWMRDHGGVLLVPASSAYLTSPRIPIPTAVLQPYSAGSG
jgi:hypothetical protein